MYREWLQQEIADKKYYRSLLMNKMFPTEAELNIQLDDFPTVNRITSLSAMRREAERIHRVKKEQPVDSNPKLTEAEQLFQEKLNG